jgi:hypothetical protein
MRMMLIAAAAALAMGAAPAFAHNDGSTAATTRFTRIQTQVAEQQAPARHTNRNPGNVRLNSAQSHNIGTWLFPPSQGGGQH